MASKTFIFVLLISIIISFLTGSVIYGLYLMGAYAIGKIIINFITDGGRA